MDESEGDLDYVMAGHVGTAETWARFSREWEALLPMATLTRNGRRRFKMREMVASEERRQNIQPFYRVIEDNVLFSLSCRFDKSELQRAQARAHDFMFRAFRHTTDFQEIWKNPWYVAFRIILDTFHGSDHGQPIKELLPEGAKVDFIFDDRSEKNIISKIWNEYIERREDDIRERYGSAPRFENDEDVLPLQAADLWAWQVREWYEWENSPVPQRMKDFDFGDWKGKKRKGVTYYADEEQLFEVFKAVAVENFADPNVVQQRFIFP